MSYVLDALRKADAERERGAVPGLHAQPLPQLSAGDDAPRPPLPWPWIAGLACVLAAAVIAWQFWPGGDAPVVAAPAPAPVPAVAPPPAPVVAAAPAATLPPPAIATSPAPAPAPAPARTQAPTPPAAAARTPPLERAPAAAPADPTLPKPAVPAGAGPVVAQNALPEEIRRQLPALRVDGSMYSADRGARFIVFNGRILHEGEEVAPGLTLEEIRLKSAVLNFKGHRYSVGF